ncbi:putative RNA-directed DNA polymerase [Tanacetum coccineum]
MIVEDDINSSDKSNPKTIIGSSSDLNLSFGDSLYLHLNDTNPSNPDLANQWDMCNSVVVTWILNSLSPELFAGAIYTKTASKIWNELKETYDKVDGSVKQLDAMVGLPTCTCDAAKHFDQHNQLIKLMQFLMGLDKSYLAIRSNLLTRESLPSVKTAFSVISGEESHRTVTSVGTTKPAATAFAVKTFDNKKKFNNNYKGSGSNSNFNSNNNNRRPNPNLKCTNCNKTGHTVDRCFDIIGYPAGYIKRNSNFNSRPVTSNNVSAKVQSNGVSSNNATTGNSHVSLSSDQLARLMNLLNENDVSTANANMAGKNLMNIRGTFFNGSVKFNLNFKRFFNGNTDVIVGNISLGWIVDSGANQHMTASANFLTNVVDVSNLGLTVGHPNGTQALITKIGDLKIINEVTLYDVLVVPEYIVNLLSVHKLSSKLFVTFDENNCYIQDLKANRNVGIGKQLNGLYMFDVNNACKIVFNNCIANCFTSKTLWHRRLGHPVDQVLDVLKTTLKLDSHSKSDHLCDTCNKAKQTREPFLLSNHKTTKISELVHLDVWGPYKITSKDGFRYFLTIVDDFSRVVWVYMLKGKDDVYDSLTSFVQMFSNQFEIKIKVYRSDNGTEFINNRLQTFFNDKGILHQTTCVYTPQQNGIAEKKHRHLLNVARSFMFQEELPLYVWINSVVELRNVSSLDILIKKKGYKLLSLENKSIFYSRDVKFYETVFPFKMKNNLKPNEFEFGVIEDLNHKYFFDSENPKRPNDEGRVSSNDDGPELSPDINQGNDDASATSMDETNNTHPEGTVLDETDFINDFYENSEFNYETKELPVHTLRRSSKQTKLPSSLNDFIVEGKVKYEVERVVNYANLNHVNYCFISALNKSVEPTCYEEAILDSNWVDAMAAEIEALNENHTWEITDLPPNKKAIGNK